VITIRELSFSTSTGDNPSVPAMDSLTEGAVLREDSAEKASTPGTAYAAYRERKYFGELDGLRALAIAAVVWNHSGTGAYQFGRGLGVKLFFTISGFLITTLLLRERAKTGALSLRNFYVRRVLRIFPLYFAVLGLYVILVRFAERDALAAAQFFANLPYFLTFTANWFVNLGDGRVIFYFAWSLSAQEQFYLVWPSVIRFARPWWIPVALMGMWLGAAEVVHWAVATGRADDSLLAVRILSRIDPTLGFGFLAAHLLHRPAGFRAALQVVDRPWSAPLAVALALVQVVLPTTPDLVPRVAMLLLVLICVARPKNVLAPVIDNRFVRYVGTISYGIYLLHMLHVNVARRIVPGDSRLAIFTLAFPATILVAGLSFRYFEQPIMNLRRFLIRSGQGVESPPALPTP
jgi:peptidoglycan/LPS O-acetylase OafA/YrhL